MYICSIRISSQNLNQDKKTTSLSLFQKTMRMLCRVAQTDKVALSEMPEFLIQNMNDLIGQVFN